MSTLRTIEREIDILKAQRDRIKARQLQAVRGSFISCTRCQRRSRLSSWTFIQKMWYTPPEGCTGGDHWNRSETRLCYMICPKCRAEEYIYTHPQRKKIVRLADDHNFSKDQLFKEIIKKEDKYSMA